MDNRSDLYDGIERSLLILSESHEDFLGAVIIGSRARVDEPADKWSDMDIILVADNSEHYMKETAWLEHIVPYTVTFIENTPLGGAKERRVLFKNDLDVDFVIVSREKFAALVEASDVQKIFARGYRVIFDKCGLFSGIKKSISNISVENSNELNEELFNVAVSNFRYHAVWSAKKIDRGELWVAKECIDVHMKSLLLMMIETCNMLQGDDLRWHGGRFLEKRTDPEILKKLSHCFARYNKQDITEALFNTMNLFEDQCVYIAEALGFEYTEETACSINKSVENITLSDE